jgi:hypothetical protein
MITRTREKTVTFASAFVLKGIDYLLPAGEYRVRTDEELIDSVSFPVYHRVATMIFVPAQTLRGAVEMVTIDPAVLQDALEQDAALRTNGAANPSANQRLHLSRKELE